MITQLILQIQNQKKTYEHKGKNKHKEKTFFEWIHCKNVQACAQTHTSGLVRPRANLANGDSKKFEEVKPPRKIFLK